VLITGLPLILPCELAGQSARLSEGPKISVAVDSVVIHVRVRARECDLVTAIEKDFHLFEDGRPRDVHLFQPGDLPVSLGLVVDSSTCMCRKRRDPAATALAFVRSNNPHHIRPQYAIGYVPGKSKLDDACRSVRVTAAWTNRGELSLGARDGCIASADGRVRKPPGHAR
jgi:hypothetical protein